MTEETETNEDEGRALTPNERKKLRIIMSQTDEGALLKMRLIIERADELTLLADSYSHMSFFGKALFRIATWLTVIVGTIILIINYKTGLAK